MMGFKTLTAAADALGLQPLTLKRYASGKVKIPEYVALACRRLQDEHNRPGLYMSAAERSENRDSDGSQRALPPQAHLAILARKLEQRETNFSYLAKMVAEGENLLAEQWYDFVFEHCLTLLIRSRLAELRNGATELRELEQINEDYALLVVRAERQAFSIRSVTTRRGY